MGSSEANTVCEQCKSPMDADALFCSKCGTPRKAKDDSDPLLGHVVGGRYLLQERLGHGASGTIYRGEHVTLRRRIAIKVLHHELSQDDLAIERFRREATTVGEIDNDHIVQIHDFGRTDDGRLYLAMEFLEGETLDARLSRDKRIEPDDVVGILIQLADALMEAHAIGYVHRDLRPRNVFLSKRRKKTNFVKLLDFGLAKLVESDAGEAATTTLGMTFGDPKYMSPEQARGDGIDRRADIYSLGCMAYEMLIGDPPFIGDKVLDILTKHVEELPTAPIDIRPDVPKWLSSTVMRMLAKKPEDRFVTVFRMAEALRQGLAKGTVMSDAEARRIETVPPPSVSLAMEKLTEPGSKPYQVTGLRQAEAPPLAPAEQERTEPSPAPVAEDKTEPMEPPSPGSTHRGIVASSVNEAASKPVGAVSKDTRSPTPVPGRVAIPAVANAGRDSAGRDSASQSAPSSGARGSLPKNLAGAAGSSSGISAAWYADGEALETGEDVEPRAAERLRRAREIVTEDTEPIYFDASESGRRLKLVGILAGAALLLVILFWAWPSGEDTPAVATEADAAGLARVAPSDAQVQVQAPDAQVSDAGSEESSFDSPAKRAAQDERKPKTEKPKTDKPKTDKPKTDKPKTKKPKTEKPKTEKPKTDPASSPENAAKADFYAKLGQTELRGGNYVTAATHFNKAKQLNPRNAIASAGLGEIALQQSAYSAAIGHLKRAVSLRRSSRNLTLLGEAYLGAGKNSKAAAAFKKALKLKPDNPRARDGYNEATSGN